MLFDRPNFALTYNVQGPLAEKEKTTLKKHEKNALYTNKDGGRKLFEINEKGECIKPKWAMVASHTARRTCITNMYLAKKSRRFS